MSRRSRWMRKRRFAGRDRPRPVVVRVVNCASVSFVPARAMSIWSRALSTAGKYGPPDLVLACEMADVDAFDADGRTWDVIQHAPVGSPESALGIAGRRGRVTFGPDELLAGSAATSEGRGIRRRPILRAYIAFDPATPHAWARRASVGHAPPPRAPIARGKFLVRFAAVRSAIKAGDLNIGARWAQRLLGKRVHSVGVLHLAVPRWIPQSRRARVDVGSDHDALDVILWP